MQRAHQLIYLLIASWILLCKGGEVSVLFHHSFNPVVNVEFDFIAVIVADLEAISILKADCKLYNLVLEIKNNVDLSFNSFIKSMCDFSNELSNPLSLSPSSPYAKDAQLIDLVLFSIDINIQKIEFAIDISEFHLLIKIENTLNNLIIAQSEINNPADFDPDFFRNKNQGEKKVELLFDPSFQPVTDVPSSLTMVLVANFKIIRALKTHCKLIEARVIIEGPQQVIYNIKHESFCAVNFDFYPLLNGSRTGRLLVSFPNFIFPQEFGCYFLMKLETLDGKLLVESEKKVYYIFKASNDEVKLEPKVAMSIDSSLFPEKDNFDEKVLITGGCGFLGRRIVNRFCELGYLVFIIDNLEDPDSVLPNVWPISKCKENQMIFKETDYLDFLRNDATFTGGDVQLNVFAHLASFTKSNSLDLDSAAFQFAAKCKPRRMIFFSDASLLLSKNAANFEFDIDFFDSNLASSLSKRTGERLAKILFEKHNIPVSIYRLSNVYGEDQQLNFPSPFISLLNQVMEKRNNPMNSKTILLDSDFLMDFVYVDDVVNCIMNTFSSAQSKTINLLSGITTSLTSLTKLMTAQAGYKIEAEIFFLQNYNSTSQENSVKENMIDGLECQFPTTLKQGIDISIQKYLEKEENKESSMKTENKFNPMESSNVKSYSAYKCLGGSQLFSDFNEQAYFDDFPSPGNPLFRVCHFKNVCLSKGKMHYFKDPQLQKMPYEYAIDSFQKNTSKGFRTSFLSSLYKNNLEIELQYYGVFSDVFRSQTAFIDFPSRSYNFGHMLNDNIIPHFAAAKLFNLSLSDGEIIYQNPCTAYQNYLSIDDENSNYLDRCLEMLKKMTLFFFSKSPLFLSEMDESKCYSDLLVGQGSTFSINSLDLSRSLYVSDVTQHILNKHPILNNYRRSSDRLNILVAQAGKKIENDFIIDLTVCERIKFCIDSTPFAYQGSFFSLPPVVNCITPENISLLEQVIAARQAHVIVSYDGALAHLAMFAQANTQQIVIKKSNIMEGKFVSDTHVFLWTNHLHTLYVKQSVYYKEICSILFLSFKNYMAFL